ncbi:MAG TPA: hypothetical protein VKB43_01980 [Gaiellaceae bacterium]|nr:hypothetical protein [Gaiellaceae bacterium]
MLAPPKPPAELLVKEARERHRRRRLLGAAVAAVATGIALGAFAVAGGFDRSRTARAPIGPGGVPLCRTSQISVSYPMLIGVLGPGRNGLPVMTNNGGTCSLPLRPPTARVAWHGTTLPTHQLPGHGIYLASWQPLRTVRVLQHGDKAAISFYWQNWCGPPHSYRPLLTVHLRFDSAFGINVPIGPRPSCVSRGAPSTIRVSRPLLVRG